MKNRIEIPEVKTWEGFPNFPTDILNPKNKNMKNNQVDLDKAFEQFKQSEEYKNNPTATGGLHDSVGFSMPRKQNNDTTVKIDGIRYSVNYDEIKVGDTAYNPVSNSIHIIDEEDDLTYVNGAYYKANKTV